MYHKLKLLSSQNASTSYFFNFLFGNLGEEPCLDDDRLFWEIALAEELEITSPRIKIWCKMAQSFQ